MKEEKEKPGRQGILPFSSIRTTMLAVFSTLIVATLTFFYIISLNYTERTILNNSIDYTTRLIGQVNRDIDSYIDYMENISSLVAHSSDVQTYLMEGRNSGDPNLYRRIVTQFSTVLETRTDISNIAVLSGDGKSIINDGNDVLNENIPLYSVDWYREAEEEGSTCLTSSHVQNVIRDNYKWVITMSRGLENPDTGEIMGVFFIDLNYKTLKDLCERNNIGSDYIYIIDPTGKIIYHPKQKLIYSSLKTELVDEVLECEDSFFLTDDEKNRRLYTISVSDKTGWSVVGVTDMAELMRGRSEAQRLYIVITAAFLVVTILLCVIFSSAITRPLERLKDSMKEAEKGKFEGIRVKEEGNNEIASLGKTFNIMIVRIRQLMEQNTYEQEQKRLSELKALQSQINPHFLYNTLDSIIWMAEGGKTKEVVLMTSSLARLLRQSISNEDELVSIKREVDYARSYLTIQKMRYQDKMEFEIHVEEEILEQQIIKLVLQPVVENAIYHGIKYKDGKGLIKITGVHRSGCINLTVYDNGKGMEPEVLEHIFDPKTGHKSKSGIGISNVQMRLQLYYGKEYGISYKSIPGEGTAATIRIPFAGGEAEIIEK